MGATPHGVYTASGISSIFGLNPYKTAVRAWQEICEKLETGFNTKRGYELPEMEDSAPLRWGLAFEPALIRLAEQEHGCEITEQEKLYKKTFGNIELSCHIDGNIDHVHKKPTLLENKTTNTRAFYMIKDEKKRWGEPGTDEVPEEYQVQAAVQRICTCAEMVELAVLVFPKMADEFEAEGWSVISGKNRTYYLRSEGGEIVDIRDWAVTFSQIGNYHRYFLPKNEKLEELIIERVQAFDEYYVQPRIHPEPESFDDIKRLLKNPIGTVIADDELAKKARLYSEITHQIGESGPLAKNREILRTEIMAEVMRTKKDDWLEPLNKVVILDPEGGDVLASFSKDKNGQTSFRSKRA